MDILCCGSWNRSLVRSKKTFYLDDASALIAPTQMGGFYKTSTKTLEHFR